jgi:sulfur-oxidizing protein SoxA
MALPTASGWHSRDMRPGISRRWPWPCCWSWLPPTAAAPAKDARRSGFDDMRPATQAMQRDDSQNPAMLWVAEGEALFQRAPLAQSKACIACHAPPACAAWQRVTRRSTLCWAGRSACRTASTCAASATSRPTHWRLTASRCWHWKPGWPTSRAASPSRHRHDPRLVPFRARGEKLFQTRIGQLNLSCAQCHDARAGLRLGGSTIPQGHPTGYPLYRLEWQAVGSLPGACAAA